VKLTKSKLKQIIKEEISLLGFLEIENNFVKRTSLAEEEYSPSVDDRAVEEVIAIIRERSIQMNDEDSYNFLTKLKEWFNQTVLEEQ
jgi:hypothetical protein